MDVCLHFVDVRTDRFLPFADPTLHVIYHGPHYSGLQCALNAVVSEEVVNKLFDLLKAGFCEDSIDVEVAYDRWIVSPCPGAHNSLRLVSRSYTAPALLTKASERLGSSVWQNLGYKTVDDLILLPESDLDGALSVVKDLRTKALNIFKEALGNIGYGTNFSSQVLQSWLLRAQPRFILYCA